MCKADRALATFVVTCLAVLAAAGMAHAVVVFDRGFGMNVIPGGPSVFENCTTATDCTGGDPVGTAGAVNAPSAVAVDAQGRILVVERGNQRVSRFTVLADGSIVFDRAFGFG